MSSLIPSTHMEYLVESSSTDDQGDAELECKPFFVDIQKLNDHEVAQLRKRGLLSLENRDVCLLYDAHGAYLRRTFGMPRRRLCRSIPVDPGCCIGRFTDVICFGIYQIHKS
jgi:hypothetical protein